MPRASASSASRRRARETVHDAADGAAALLLQDGERVVFRLAGMNDDGQIQLARETDLQAEDLLLHVFRREVVMVVEPDFAQRSRLRNRRDDTAHERDDLGFAAAELSRLMRMKADAEPQRGPDVREFSRAAGFDRVFRRKDAQRVRQPSRLRALNDRQQVGRKGVIG